MIRMTVEGVGFDQQGQTVVVLKDWNGPRILPIWIGPNEAHAIQVEIQGVQSPRPLSHDLLLSLVALLAGRVARVTICDLIDATFYAEIDIDTPRGTRKIDARPSDALALAVRARCPIFVDGGALQALVEAEEAPLKDNSQSSAAPPSDGESEDEIERFKRLLGE